MNLTQRLILTSFCPDGEKHPCLPAIWAIQLCPEGLEFSLSFAWGKHFIARQVWEIGERLSEG